MLSFKGYVLRWLAATMQLAPFTADRIMPLLKASAQAAVDHCNIGDNGRMCTFNWTIDSPGWNTGVGQQMNALAALFTLLINQAKPPVTNLTGGTSVGNPNAGSAQTLVPDPIRSRDRVGATLVTILLAGGTVAVFAWISWPEGMCAISWFDK
jgi:mannan endo-1,6-alpha-mannosidase